MLNNLERSYLRDMQLSQKLRERYGYMVDIDALHADFHNFKPAGLSEYKHFHMTDVRAYFRSVQAKIVRSLADSAAVPFSCIIYKPGQEETDPWQYNLKAMNEKAVDILGHDIVPMSEQDLHRYHAQIRQTSELTGYPELKGWVHPEL